MIYISEKQIHSLKPKCIVCILFELFSNISTTNFCFVKHISKFSLSSYDDTKEDNTRKTKLQHIQLKLTFIFFLQILQCFWTSFCVSRLVHIFQYILLYWKKLKRILCYKCGKYFISLHRNAIGFEEIVLLNIFYIQIKKKSYSFFWNANITGCWL